MADQISKIRFKRLVLQFTPPRICLQTLMIGLWMLVANICSVQTSTCPPSVPISAATTTEQCSFTEYTNTRTFGVAGGPISNSLYYLYWIYIPNNAAVIRKVDSSGSQTWMTSFGFWPIAKSLSVDVAEQSVYLASETNPLVVLILAANDGSIVSQHQL